MAQLLFTMFRAKVFFPLFWSRSMFLQKVLTDRKAAAKTCLPQLVPTATKALLFLV